MDLSIFDTKKLVSIRSEFSRLNARKKIIERMQESWILGVEKFKASIVVPLTSVETKMVEAMKKRKSTEFKSLTTAVKEYNDSVRKITTKFESWRQDLSRKMRLCQPIRGNVFCFYEKKP